MESSSNEIKTLAEWILDAIFAIAVVAVLSLLIVYVTRFNNVLEKRQASKQAMQSYAEYVAYSNTTVRGQELLSLAANTKGDPFILIYKDSNCIAAIYNDESQHTEIWDFSTDAVASITDNSTRSAASVAVSTLQDNVIGISSVFNGSTVSLDATNINQIQTWLLSRGSNKYKSYNTALLYDTESSLVIGIIALEVS